jgi:hypothetical protein
MYLANDSAREHTLRKSFSSTKQLPIAKNILTAGWKFSSTTDELFAKPLGGRKRAKNSKISITKLTILEMLDKMAIF